MVQENWVTPYRWAQPVVPSLDPLQVSAGLLERHADGRVQVDMEVAAGPGTRAGGRSGRGGEGDPHEEPVGVVAAVPGTLQMRIAGRPGTVPMAVGVVAAVAERHVLADPDQGATEELAVLIGRHDPDVVAVAGVAAPLVLDHHRTGVGDRWAGGWKSVLVSLAVQNEYPSGPNWLLAEVM